MSPALLRFEGKEFLWRAVLSEASYQQREVFKETKFSQKNKHILEHHISHCGACMHVQLLGRVWLFATLWTVARQASLFMGFSRQEYWRGLPFLTLGHLPNLLPPALAGRFFTVWATKEAQEQVYENTMSGISCYQEMMRRHMCFIHIYEKVLKDFLHFVAKRKALSFL